MAESENYKEVTTAVLKVYELVPEAYPQKFRNVLRQDKTHVEFVRELTTLLNCSQQIHELLLLKQFKSTLPDRLTTYLNEHKEKTASEAAVLADEYILTHIVCGDWC